MIPLGWGIFRWVNKYAVIPMFNWLDKKHHQLWNYHLNHDHHHQDDISAFHFKGL